MSHHPALSGTKVRVVSGTLSDNNPDTVNLGALFTEGIVVGYEIKNTHASGDLYWSGEGDTAAATDAPVLATESSGWIPSNDKTLSLIRETGVAVTYVIVVSGR
ncbi:MAG: hypothetical protein IT379_39935 [Deltaproteobacteria bacterium]|nr:hypothetical protein [Deltaproteobacteria bacterium]